MDFLVLKKNGHGIQTMLAEALGKQGTSVILDMGRREPVDFGLFIEEKIKETGGKPLTVLLDISSVEQEPYMMPLTDIVQSRRIGGTALPARSSVIIAMNDPGPGNSHLIPAPLAARTVRLDLTTPGFAPGPGTSDEGLVKLQERVGDAVLNMVAAIHDFQGLTNDHKPRDVEPETPGLR